jgi:acetolactate synthase I/II/III large subunit
MNAADLLIAGLRERGIEWIATLCGHGLDPLLHAARKAGMRLVDVRNEQTCAYMADAAGRLTGRPGVCAVSSGIAHLNALTGVANAWFDRAPMLLISGAASSHTAGLGHFQDLDQVTLAKPITKYSRAIDHAERTRQILDEALDEAEAAPQGPVHLMFPMNVQTSEPGELTQPWRVRSPEFREDTAAVSAALKTAKAPLVIAGSGMFYNGYGPDMLRFCERAAIPIVTPIWDRGIINQPSRVFQGVIGAATGGAEILSHADCILLAGAVVDYRLGYLQHQNAKIFRFERNWHALQSPAHEEWLKQCSSRHEEFRKKLEPGAPAIIRAIHDVLGENPVLLIDGGSIGQWAHQVLCHDRYPSDWLTCGRSGVVGWGLGGAMAARLVFPNRPVILLSGDGAFTFTVAELECAVRQKLAFVALVADDQGWGITRLGHVRQFGEAIASDLGPINFTRLAESLGARGVYAETPEKIAAELREAIARPQVTVIHVPIEGGNP